MSYFVYILLCADGSFYTGSTNDIDKRLKEHNESKNGAHYTKIRRPVKLVYKEKFDSLGSARAREAEIKRMNKNDKEMLIKSMLD